MAKIKIYSCCICHKVLEEYKPIRLVKQVYGGGSYKQYHTLTHYDFCKDCYKKFAIWIWKNNKGVAK